MRCLRLFIDFPSLDHGLRLIALPITNAFSPCSPAWDKLEVRNKTLQLFISYDNADKNCFYCLSIINMWLVVAGNIACNNSLIFFSTMVSIKFAFPTGLTVAIKCSFHTVQFGITAFNLHEIDLSIKGDLVMDL